MDDIQQPAVQATIRHALSRGYLPREKLREALLLHEQLRDAGRPSPLLSILAARFLRPEHVQELTRVYREALGQQVPFDATASARGAADARAEAATADALDAAKVGDLPADVLKRSCDMLELPPEADPEPVKRFLRESELALQKLEDVDDRVFVGLARKAGYPTPDELKALAREQAERRRRNDPPVSLFLLGVVRGLLDERRQKRFLRWAKQVTEKDQAPLEEEEGTSPGAAPVALVVPPPAAAAPRRVLAASAIDVPIPTRTCAVCGVEVEVLVLVESATPADEKRTLCASCAACAKPAPAPAPAAPAPTPASLPAPAGGRREGRARRVARAVRNSASFVTRGLIKPSRAVEAAEAGPTARAPRAVVAGLAVATTSAALLLVALVVTIAGREGGAPAVPATEVKPADTSPDVARADAAWGGLRGARSAADAATALRRFAIDFPRDRRAVDAVLLAGLLDLHPGLTGDGGAGVPDALVAEAARLAPAEPAAAAAMAEVAERLAPGHAGAARLRKQLLDAALRAAAELKDELVAQSRAGQGPAALRRAIEEAGRWRGLGQDAALAALVERLARTTTDPAGAAQRDPGPPPTAPPPGPTPRPTAPASGPLPARPATASAAGVPPGVPQLYAEAVSRLAEDDAAGLAAARGKLEQAAPDARETRAARGFERFLGGRHADAVEQLLAALDLEDGWVPWVLVRAAFFSGRYAEARRALARLPEGSEQSLWRLLIDGPFRDRAPAAAGACEGMSASGRYRLMTDVGLDLGGLEARVARAKPDERDDLVARARRGNRALAELTDLMDKAARAYGNLLEAEPREQVVPTVYVLSDEARFHAFSEKLRMGSTENVLGYYSPTYRVLVFYEREAEREGGRALSAATQEVLLHESFHQWLRLHVADAPTWFDEGFAEFFAFSDVGKDGLHYGLLPSRYPSRLDTIRRALSGRDASPPLPLERFLLLEHPAFMEEPQVYTNYAHAWSLVHFLASTKPGQKALRDYFGALREGKDLAGARDAAFGKADLGALEREWRAYVEKLPVTLPLETRVRAVRLHQLEGFYFVATHGGFTRAADAMPYPITEPALHQQVRKLERALGVSLLVRGPKRRMLLTPDGRRLLAFVAPYFENLPPLLREVAQGDAGELVVGAEPLYVEGVVAPALAAVRARRPAARLRIVEADLVGLLAAVRRGEVDAGLAGVVAPPPDVAFERLGSLGLSLLVPPGHPLLRRRGALELQHLEGLAVVAYERGSDGRRFGDAVLDRVGLRLAVAAEASTAAAMRALVRVGVGPAIVPAIAPPRPGRRAGPDGVVAVDITALARKVADLPPWGALRRAGPPSALLTSFLEAARGLAARGGA